MILSIEKPLSESATKGQPTDAELVIALQNGDQNAMTTLLKRHERTIPAMFYKLAPDFRDNGDMVQEAMIRMWRGVSKLKNPYAFKTWLNQIVSNLFYDELRKRPRDFTIVSLDETLPTDQGGEGSPREIACTHARPEEALLNQELADVLEKAIAKVPTKFRDAIVMREVEGMSYEQIAQITDTELGTVKSRISRARTKMQKSVNVYLNEHRIAA